MERVNIFPPPRLSSLFLFLPTIALTLYSVCDIAALTHFLNYVRALVGPSFGTTVLSRAESALHLFFQPFFTSLSLSPPITFCASALADNVCGTT